MMPSTGTHLPGVDDDDVALVEPVERHLDFGAVPGSAVGDEPTVARLLAESPEHQLLRVVFGPPDQVSAEPQAPREDRAREYLQSCQAPRDNNRVEDIDTEAPLFEEHIVSALEARDRGIGEQCRRER